MRNKFETLARAGYAARGVVYILLGGLAFMSALNGGGGTEDSSGALSHVLQFPFGRVLLGLIAIGLAGHIAWRLAQGFLDADNVGTDGKGLVGRVGSLISAGANVFLALTAARMALGQGGGSSGGGGESEASAWLLQQPFGPFLLGLVAIGVIGAGLVQIGKGVTRKYRDRLDLPSSPKVLDFACLFGLVARGALLAIVGGFVAYAALTVSPEQAGGISDALDYVYALPFGRWLYGTAALGLVAFGCYSIIQAVYRHMNAPSLADVKQALPG
ncbi:DUF1206 domain-containing protein [Devosia sp. BK]|uniref:DUF1206 domain-containing protein n=1 Tax=unclassified Devosia TaxID=196773 RepID=UPI000715FEE2|nr:MULTISPECIES: DUF1206 domain-containing protein [unclassified Devosia]KQN77150.1 hypothetical protein ASE94_16680 [Devosia sp. Leaf64]KQT47246.1 hypothetical protein ASG47_11770 [Devosia sp. Leaf420]MDV3252789.1 DUF1206 domain-containing protein [Devosia sp. BK]